MQADIGCIVSKEVQWVNVARYWCHLMNMNDNCIKMCVFKWSLSKSGHNVTNSY